jgi:Tfp pilus assembly protein PilF
MVAIAFAFLLLQADYSAQGLKALDDHKYEAAVQAFTKAIEQDPKDYSAHFNLALAYGFLRKDADGVAEYRKTLELKPALYEAQLNCGILLMRQKQPSEALPLFTAAVEQKPKEFRPRYYLAEAQLQTGDFEKALENFRAAAELDPKSAAPELGMAHALAREGKLAEADPHFRRAAQLDPEYRNDLLELAQLYEENKQPAAAIAIYKEFPDNVAAQEHLGKLMLDTRQYADAIPRLEETFKKDPTPANRVALAMAYLFSEQLDRATPLLREAVAAQPDDYEVRMMYARALRDQKQFTAAAAQFYAAAKLKPAEPKTWNELGGMLYMTGDLQQAYAAFDRAHQLGDDTAGNWFLRAIILDKSKQVKPALEAYQKFLSMSGGKNPDQEFQARQRVRILTRELEKR